ncbi:Hint domain-containing protein [Pontibaca methylaminivorans]|uniref:Hint domain-containing protein n=1 Tax=Pontibaca methylaminivorans TaxID=515897 RepID=UPI002FD98708
MIRLQDDAARSAGTIRHDHSPAAGRPGHPRTVPCFTRNTLIATPCGARPAEDLREGDRVLTRDNGFQRFFWHGSCRLSGADLAASPHLAPVLIRAGSLGEGLPLRDLLVSPGHRLLLAADRATVLFEEREVLVAAHHLTGCPGVERPSCRGVTYVHFMFAQHEIVLSDGAWSESFQPGDHSLTGVGAMQRKEIFALFPELRSREGRENYRAARRSLRRHEARLLAS